MSAVDAALTVARAHGLPTEHARVIRDLTNVLVHLDPAPVVARVPITLARLRDAGWFETELQLARFLAREGAPIAPPTDDLDPGPHVCDGFSITFWRWIDHDLERADPAAAGRALRELHAVLATYPGELPTCDRLDEVRRLLATFPASADIDELRQFAERLTPVSGRPIHGDAHLQNVLWSPAGPLWGDLENVCRGPVEWDLACLRFRGRVEDEEAISAYGEHSERLVEDVMPHLTLFLAAWTLVVVDRTDRPRAHEEARRRVERALAYAREM